MQQLIIFSPSRASLVICPLRKLRYPNCSTFTRNHYSETQVLLHVRGKLFFQCSMIPSIAEIMELTAGDNSMPLLGYQLSFWTCNGFVYTISVCSRFWYVTTDFPTHSVYKDFKFLYFWFPSKYSIYSSNEPKPIFAFLHLVYSTANTAYCGLEYR